MISYAPLFETMAQKGITSYRLEKMGFSRATYYSIKCGNSVSTNTINQSVRSCIARLVMLWSLSKSRKQRTDIGMQGWTLRSSPLLL